MYANVIYPFFLFLPAFILFSCKKSDSDPGVTPGPVTPPVTVMTIASISPASGPSTTLDTIAGKGFTALDSVFFNGKGAVVVSTSDTQLVVKVPPQAGTGTISITVGGKSLTGPVFTFTGNTYMVSTFAGSGTASSINGTGTAAGFNLPYFIATGKHDTLYVVDNGSNQIRKITPACVVSTFAGSGAKGAADGPGATASFNSPSGITVGGDGNVYVVDNGNKAIRKITPDGVVSTFAASVNIASADAIAASSFNPSAVTVDGNNNVFVADNGNNEFWKITPAGVVSYFAGSGHMGSADGPRTAASFNKINGISCDAAGNLYVADGGNNNLRKITSDGTVTTIAGKAGAGGYADGTGSTASFSNPNCIAVDANGFMYVADAFNYVIRQGTPAGAVTTLAGRVGVKGNDDGPSSNASFTAPSGMAIDSQGNIFATDIGSNLIRKLTPQ